MFTHLTSRFLKSLWSIILSVDILILITCRHCPTIHKCNFLCCSDKFGFEENVGSVFSVQVMPLLLRSFRYHSVHKECRKYLMFLSAVVQCKECVTLKTDIYMSNIYFCFSERLLYCSRATKRKT